jgi:DNA polymerase III epsilon subunit family exonuclease
MKKENLLPSDMPFIINLYGATENYIVIDVETTGLSPVHDRIVQLSAIKIKGRIPVESCNYYLDPTPVRIPPVVRHILGLDRYPEIERQIYSGQTVEDIKSKVLDFLEDYTLVAHNARFDQGFLYSALKKLKNPIIDTLEIGLLLHPESSSHRLETLVEKSGITIEKAKKFWPAHEMREMTTWEMHNAVTDISLLGLLYEDMTARFYDRNNMIHTIVSALMPETCGNTWTTGSPDIAGMAIKELAEYINHKGLINYIAGLNDRTDFRERYILSYLLSWRINTNNDDLNKISYWCKRTFKQTWNIIRSIR